MNDCWQSDIKLVYCAKLECKSLSYESFLPVKLHFKE